MATFGVLFAVPQMEAGPGVLDKHCASETYTQPWIKAFEFLKFLCRTWVSPPSESLQGWGRDMVTQRYSLPRPRYILHPTPMGEQVRAALSQNPTS